MLPIYKDRHGNQIKAGMTLRHKDGETKKVYVCSSEGEDLGFNACNPEFLRRHPDWPEQYYPLYQFDLTEWEIVEQ